MMKMEGASLHAHAILESLKAGADPDAKRGVHSSVPEGNTAPDSSLGVSVEPMTGQSLWPFLFAPITFTVNIMVIMYLMR